MKKISAIIITFNEETNIRRCLDSVKDVVDEIVVVDSFSTDQTEVICKEYGVRFIQRKFDGYRDQKNFANAQAEYDYVLSLDADEALNLELKKSILKVKEEGLSADAYVFNRLNFFCGKAIKHGGWYPDKKIRLWNRTKGKWGGNNLHEIIDLEKDTSQSSLSGDLLHYSFTSVGQHIRQIDKFSDMKAELDFEVGKKSNIFKILFHPLVKFFLLYFVKLGILDGYYGLIIAINSAHFTFLRYVKLKSKQNNKQ